MQLFYVPDIDGKQVTLNPIESIHCIKVLRLTLGDTIHLIDGKGGFYKAQIAEPNPKSCILNILSKEENFGEKDFYLHIAIAPTKNIDRFEWFLEKSTEIGINEITPIVCQYSERKMIKPERLNKILISAIKQSKNAFLPKLNELTAFKDFISSPFDGEKYIAHCSEVEKTHLKNQAAKKSKCLILIGPEGDFSEEEIIKSKEFDFQDISLGESRLRTETAGVVACHTINLINE